MNSYKFYSKSAFDNNKKNIDFHVFSGGSTQLHSHDDYYELLYVTKGPIKYIINDEHVLLNKGALTIVRPCDKHMFNNPSGEEAQHINIAIKTDFFNIITNIINPLLINNLGNAKTFPLVYMDETEFAEAERWRRKIYTTQSSHNEESFSLITTLLVLLLSFYNYKSLSQNDNIPTWLNDLIVKINSNDFINKSVADIYDISNYSPPILINAFKKYFNKTPSKYLIDIKINYACNLLQNTDYSILSISSILGYDSLSHFNHTFKKVKGETPAVYRKKFE